MTDDMQPSAEALLAAASLQVPALPDDPVWLGVICDDASKNWDPEPWPDDYIDDPESDTRHGFRGGWAAATRALESARTRQPDDRQVAERVVAIINRMADRAAEGHADRKEGMRAAARRVAIEYGLDPAPIHSGSEEDHA
jgi:hypothetical protein